MVRIRRRWRNAIALTLIACLVALGSASVSAADDSELADADSDLFTALGKQDLEAAAAALKAGANIDAVSPRGQQTPLMQNVLHGRAESVRWCLENGADATIGERDGYTPMHGAGFQGHAEIAEMLMKHGVGLRDMHKDGHEPAVRACWGPEKRHLKTLEFFLNNGVPLDAIYDKCLEMAKNPDTVSMLTNLKAKSEL